MPWLGLRTAKNTADSEFTITVLQEVQTWRLAIGVSDGHNSGPRVYIPPSESLQCLFNSVHFVLPFQQTAIRVMTL
jgi:hypothetical protein